MYRCIDVTLGFLFLAHCPPVHLLLSTNHLVSALEKAWDFGALKWMRQAFQRFLKKKYFGGTLEGNQCSKLIENFGQIEFLQIQKISPRA